MSPKKKHYKEHTVLLLVLSLCIVLVCFLFFFPFFLKKIIYIGEHPAAVLQPAGWDAPMCKTCSSPQHHQQTLGLRAEPPALALGKHVVIFNYTRRFWITHSQIHPPELLLWSPPPAGCTSQRGAFPQCSQGKVEHFDEAGACGPRCVMASRSRGRELLLGWEKVPPCLENTVGYHISHHQFTPCPCCLRILSQHVLNRKETQMPFR